MGNLLYQEQSLAMRETWDFLDREVKAVQAMISVMELEATDIGQLVDIQDDVSQSRLEALRAAIDAVEWVLRIAHRQFNEWDRAESRQDKSKLFDEINRYHETVPEFLHAISTSIVQRHQKGITQVISGAGAAPIFSLSEVHLSQSLTVRGIENLSSWFNFALKGYWGRLPIANPILTISSGLFPMFQGPPEECSRLILSEKSIREQYSRILNLSHIVMPRWAPSQIRYFALMGHEHFHRVLYLLKKTEFLLKRIDKQDRSTQGGEDPGIEKKSEENYRLLWKNLSPQSHDLRSIWKDAISYVESFYKEENLDYKLNGVFDSASDHAEEYMCDAAGLILCGPSQLYASVSYLYKSPELDELQLAQWYRGEDDCPEHPPQGVRLLLQRKLLQKLGFREEAKYIGEEFGIDRLEYLIAHENFPHLLKHYRQFAGEEFMAILVKTMLSAMESMESTPMLCEPHVTTEADPIFFTGGGGQEGSNENLYNVRIKELGAIIQKGHVFPRNLTNYSPVDVLNAVWCKLYRGREQNAANEYRMQWRQALKNVAIRSRKGATV